jgi:hypothetical protein
VINLRSYWAKWMRLSTATLYQAVGHENEATANLMLLWPFLDSRDLWYSLFNKAGPTLCSYMEFLNRSIRDRVTQNNLRGFFDFICILYVVCDGEKDAKWRGISWFGASDWL